MISRESSSGTERSTSQGGFGCAEATATSVEIGSEPWNGGLPRGEAVEHAAKAEQIAAVVDRPPASLLRRHVRRRAQDHARARDARCVAGGPDEPEVEEFDPPAVAPPTTCFPA